MSSNGLQLSTRMKCFGSSRVFVVCRSDSAKGRGRNYATRNPVNVDFGNSTLFKTTKTSGRNAQSNQDFVGPFQLGISPSSLRQGEKVPRWSELSTTGKVMRTTARTTNLGVILLGAGLSALLIYSLTSELFSKNSPTVLYGDACERINRSEHLAKYLNGPLTFHNNPPSSTRPRHRNRHISSQLLIDQHGQEHMIITFYVQGQPEGEIVSPLSEHSYVDTATTWIQDKAAAVSESSFNDSWSWVGANAKDAWDKSIAVFKYLSGDPIPPIPPVPQPVQSKTESFTESSWNFAGIFSSLKASRGSNSQTSSKPLSGKKFTEGQVHADLIKNKDGYFVFRYILVDLPSSKSGSTRVFIERQTGVKETEPITRWASSSS